jgi:hypothetical protein
MATRTSLRSSTYRGLTGTPDNPTAAAEASEPCSRGASGRVVALHKQLNDSAYRRARPGFGEEDGRAGRPPCRRNARPLRGGGEPDAIVREGRRFPARLSDTRRLLIAGPMVGKARAESRC